jgi:hypothetical protein
MEFSKSNYNRNYEGIARPRVQSPVLGGKKKKKKNYFPLLSQ